MINFENLDKANYLSKNRYNIPEIKNLTIDESIIKKLRKTEWIPFSDVMTTKDTTNKGVHFFIDDYRFIRVWNQPDRYIQMLKKNMILY